MIYEPYCEMEMLRCIHVGLLCVQEFAKDRPIISVVISMLKSEIVDLGLEFFILILFFDETRS